MDRSPNAGHVIDRFRAEEQRIVDIARAEVRVFKPEGPARAQAWLTGG